MKTRAQAKAPQIGDRVQVRYPVSMFDGRTGQVTEVLADTFVVRFRGEEFAQEFDERVLVVLPERSAKKR